MRITSFLTTFAILPPIHAAIAGSSTKRGLVYVPSQKNPGDDNVWIKNGSDLTWYYTYGVTPVNAFQGKMQFVPMLWGLPKSSDDTSFYDSVVAMKKSGQNITYVLGFNEPDGTSSTGGSSIDPSAAAQAWIRVLEPLRKLGIQLGAPAVTGSPNGFTWLQKFFAACNGKCTADFIPIHWYGNFEGLASHMGQYRAAYPNMTQWVTEYALAHDTMAATQNFFNTSAEYMDRISYVTHYSYFGSFRSDVSNVGPNVPFLDSKGRVTDIGSWYLRLPKGTSASSSAGATTASSFAVLLLAIACSILGIVL